MSQALEPRQVPGRPCTRWNSEKPVQAIDLIPYLEEEGGGGEKEEEESSYTA
jgi:hypothetical protein